MLLCSDGITDIGRYYAGDGSNVYYLNNFDSLPQSFGELNTKAKTYICTCVHAYYCIRCKFGVKFILVVWQIMKIYQINYCLIINY